MSYLLRNLAVAVLSVLLITEMSWAGAKPGNKPSGGPKPGSKPSVGPKPGSLSGKGKGKVRRPKHRHFRKGYRGGELEEGYQDVRLLRISNQTGDTLSVFVQLPDEERPRRWTFEPGEVAYLNIDGERLAADELRVWATADGRQWAQYREDPLVLASEPYRSDGIATHTLTFN